MILRDSFKKEKKKYYNVKMDTANIPENLICKCKKCNSVVFVQDVKENNYSCPKCGRYFRMHAKRRIKSVADKGSFEPWFEGMEVQNPLDYDNYPEKIAQLKEKTGLDEAVITGKVTIGGKPACVAAMDGRFLMASMGRIVGEKITRTVERATEENLPVIIFACSGGARMQEGIVSLMQMAKTSAAFKRHSDSGNLYISVLTDPTTGGVTASFAMLGDIILAEPKALIGFAGPRVIEQTIGQKLPKGFQRSEFLLEHGFIDAIVPREEMRDTLDRILTMHAKEKQEVTQPLTVDLTPFKHGMELSPWERVQVSRRNDRPVGEDYIQTIFPDFIEFHGDRYYKDDASIIGGIATLGGMPVTVIAQTKGHDTKENLKRNFGMPSPDGYRKALRLMKQAEKFARPIICIVDTPGAFCGIEAEQRGQGEAIARNLYEMSAIRTPILSILIGEGGSGGALAMAVADEVWMLENAVYSILSPEGYASILWKDSSLAPQAANTMRMTADNLKQMNIVERVFPEPENYTLCNLENVTEPLKKAIYEFIVEKSQIDGKKIAQKRYERFRNM